MTSRRIGITRVHLEEDTGKSFHVGATGRIADSRYSLVDYNRAGIPLVEVVSEPDIRSSAEAQRYVSELRGILEALGVSDVRMEEGSMRCDANVSLRRPGEGFGVKVEIKNLNSIRSVGRALNFEIERQSKALDAGERLVQETRHFDEGIGRDENAPLQGGSVRLPLLPRAGPRPDRARPGVDRRAPRAAFPSSPARAANAPRRRPRADRRAGRDRGRFDRRA